MDFKQFTDSDNKLVGNVIVPLLYAPNIILYKTFNKLTYVGIGGNGYNPK